MQPSIVLDKSYLQRATRTHVHALAASHRLLMSEALLYELLSKSADYRRCFSKLPAVDNPVDIVWHVGGYLKREIEGAPPVPEAVFGEARHRLSVQLAAAR